MIKSGPAYLACDGCERALWPGEGHTMLVDVTRLHVCSKVCARSAVEKLLVDLPETPEDAEAKQVATAAGKVEVEAHKAEWEEHAKRMRDIQVARHAAIKSAIEAKVKRGGQ